MIGHISISQIRNMENGTATFTVMDEYPYHQKETSGKVPFIFPECKWYAQTNALNS